MFLVKLISANWVQLLTMSNFTWPDTFCTVDAWQQCNAHLLRVVVSSWGQFALNWSVENTLWLWDMIICFDALTLLRIQTNRRSKQQKKHIEALALFALLWETNCWHWIDMLRRVSESGKCSKNRSDCCFD